MLLLSLLNVTWKLFLLKLFVPHQAEKGQEEKRESSDGSLFDFSLNSHHEYHENRIVDSKKN